MTKNFFSASDPKKSQNELEKEILDFWKKHEIFQKSVEQRNPRQLFRFFDGPPFATGSPHYGHILAGTIKDAIPRYWTMKGYRVERQWGWDCHGVPVEFQVEKEHKIGGKPGIEKMGVGKFNELCRSIVLRCADDWKDTVDRMGRAVDFENDYKTMDPEFMESVWWVFKTLWDKGLIYEGEKVVPYSPKLGSPLSNFEAGLNYKNIDDPAVTVKFKVKDKKISAEKIPTYFLAWTTTPWTLPSNLALCVNPELEYVVVEKNEENFVLVKNLVEKLFEKDAKILKKISGKDLLEISYEPLFPFFKNHKNAFQILGDNFVGAEDGTGIVHMAPNFGEDDARVCAENDIQYLDPNPIDENGYFNAEETPPLNGKYFRSDEEVEGSKENNANNWVVEQLKEKNLLFKREQIRHEYPFCWRTECALQYRGVKTWFVAVQKIKETMIAKNKNINWIPEYLKEGRFGKILETAPDWAISRNRYWGCPLPVWRGEKSGKVVVMGSREALAEKLKISAEKITDLHRHFVDGMTWEEDGEIFRRIPEVLDCWFESGSMPYASVHYPFETGEENTENDLHEVAPGIYLVTFNTDRADRNVDKENYVGDSIFDTAEVRKELAEIFREIIQKEGYRVYELAIMPNHVHMMVEVLEGGSSLPKIINKIKGRSSYTLKTSTHGLTRGLGLRERTDSKGNQYQTLWRKGYHAEFVGETDEDYDRTVEYIRRNPIEAGLEEQVYDWLGHPEDPTLPSTFNNQYFVMRHGEAENNVQRIDTGITNDPAYHLTKKGKEQVQTSAKNFPEAPDLILYSPITRTVESAKILADHFKCEMQEEVRLIECDLGSWAEKPYDEVNAYMRNHDVHHTGFPNGESFNDIQRRMAELVQELEKKYRGKRIMLVSHGSPIQALMQWTEAKNDGFVSTQEALPENGEILSLTQKLSPPDVVPHERGEEVEGFLPANFIAEGLDQTRGWFYTLHVLGCGLFEKNIFENVITNGIVLAEDGQKMSKSKKNYPDPNLIFEKYGADAMRFYLLSSPVVRGENFRFAEKGVEEVLKSVILPLKSAYQFFSTYANIDGWEPTRITTVRHGEAEHNLENIYSSKVDDPYALTKKGREQMKNLGEEIGDFDALFYSPLKRTVESAEMLKQETGFKGIFECDNRLKERDFGDWEGKKYGPRYEILQQSGGETLDSVLDRYVDLIADIQKKFRGKRVLLVGHSDATVVIRQLLGYRSRSVEDFCSIPGVKNAFPITFFPNPTPGENKLDRWILSELQILIDQFRTAMDAYQLDKTCELFAPFIDKLNNWYLRQNRRRFWKNGLDDDKISAYETLHHVLLTISKLIAPIMPFFADFLYRSTSGTCCGNQSVHLRFLPLSDKKLIDPDLNKKINLMRELTGLSATIRAKKTIKLRQPLDKLQVAGSALQEILTDKDLETIAYEANVKTVEILDLEEIERIAKRILVVDARKVGPRLGKKVQQIIQAGKAGNFSIENDGSVLVAEETLSSEEFSVQFQTVDEKISAEASNNCVVVLQTKITEDLRLEGMARDLIRAIQERRKSQGFEVSDRVTLTYQTDSEDLEKMIKKFRKKISAECLIEAWGKGSGEAKIDIEGEKLKIELNKK